MSTAEARPAPRGGRADKHAMILDGALRVFARCGYPRASVDVIAKEAGVSTRTIYNHFRDKTELYAAVVSASTEAVSAHHIALIDRHLRKVTDLRTDLTDLAVDWSSDRPEHEAHFALFRQSRSVPEIPEQTLEEWYRNGPVRVRAALARRLEDLAARGLLRVDDPELAALQFSVLVSLPDPSGHSRPRGREEAARFAAEGVRTFLHGHAPAEG
ncbi:TetR/AcrR family transcriptional regulator [Streptomonospora nanhaiensis]|uniref:TetR/AcrR family transcriptional regulator n=1 Tax=Streptomonospora nanhaiensis TaxID=1323731 RepID=A0ABY6YLR2_9ACTN|nr:TetR/AcrR family transcriptional regulator [Streptomonospora nanhaiensis]WAE73140.1 TetR/AcrR family transcriptional regulator [Streptomonospora nanhaiensis]